MCPTRVITRETDKIDPVPIIPITLRFHAVSIHRGGGARAHERERESGGRFAARVCVGLHSIRGENTAGRRRRRREEGLVKGLAGSLADEREFSRWDERAIGT